MVAQPLPPSSVTLGKLINPVNLLPSTLGWTYVATVGTTSEGGGEDSVRYTGPSARCCASR